MRHVRREVGRHPIHVNVLLREIIENAMQVTERDAQVRRLLPAPGIVALEPLRAEHLDRKAKPEFGFVRRSAPQSLTSSALSAGIQPRKSLGKAA
jgi:hypothetical protein